VTHERSRGVNVRDAPHIAAYQHGAIKASQIGLSRSGISGWVKSGRLFRKYRGVYAYGHPHLSREGEWMAAILAAGDGAALAGMCAAALLRVTKREPREIDVVAPGHRRPQPGVLDEALRLHLSGSAGTRSRLEKRFKRLVRGAGLPEPRINTIVNGFEVDAYWPGVCVEVDGLGHRRPRTQVEDRIRDAALGAAGYTLLRFTEDDINDDPAKVLADLGDSVRKRLQ
jgi:very-short-patch-repair endonuclease